MRVSSSVAALVVALVSACGGTQRAETWERGTADVDSGAPAHATATSGADVRPPDVRVPNPTSNVFPAPHGPIPPVTYQGGNILASPRIVTITFEGDTQRASLEAFGDIITTTAWWDAVSGEYCDSRGSCIGHGRGGVYGRIAKAPATYLMDSSLDASPLQSYVATRIQDGSIPPPQPDAIYLIYLPSSTTVDVDGATSCKDFLAYHSIMQVTPPGSAAPVQVVYTVVPRCSNSIDALTKIASHEIIEAATDPYPYSSFGSRDDAWDYLTGGGEVGDRCVDTAGTGRDTYEESGYLVQRSWSNAAAKASHDPCVPAPSRVSQAYFNTAASVSDRLFLKAGATKTFELTAFSDHPAPPFSVAVMEVSGLFGSTNILDVRLDQSTLQNGQKATLTVTRHADAGPNSTAFQVTSTLGQVSHAWSFTVSPE